MARRRYRKVDAILDRKRRKVMAKNTDPAGQKTREEIERELAALRQKCDSLVRVLPTPALLQQQVGTLMYSAGVHELGLHVMLDIRDSLTTLYKKIAEMDDSIQMVSGSQEKTLDEINHIFAQVYGIHDFVRKQDKEGVLRDIQRDTSTLNVVHHELCEIHEMLDGPMFKQPTECPWCGKRLIMVDLDERETSHPGKYLECAEYRNLGLCHFRIPVDLCENRTEPKEPEEPEEVEESGPAGSVAGFWCKECGQVLVWEEDQAWWSCPEHGLRTGEQITQAEPEGSIQDTVDRIQDTEAEEKESEEPRCRICGCTQDSPCIDPDSGEPCHWAEKYLCSVCHKKLLQKPEGSKQDTKDSRQEKT